MCTLILGSTVLGPGTLVLGANRDESPQRSATGPVVLHEQPRVIGGRDLSAGGTWLAVREARFVAALMNRWPGPDVMLPAGATPRSRGLLCLDLATDTASAVPTAATAQRLLAAADYGPCTLIGIDALGDAWAVRGGAGARDPAVIPDGWHVITHADVDDPDEPRTAALRAALADFRPSTPAQAIDRVTGLLRGHGEASIPPVCIHRELFPTVSSSVLVLGRTDRPRFLHAPGPPCRTGYSDLSALVLPEPPHPASVGAQVATP